MVIYMKKILDTYVLSNSFKETLDFYDDDINKKVEHLLKCVREAQNCPVFSNVSEVKIFPKIYNDEGVQEIKILVNEKKGIYLFIAHVINLMPMYYSYYTLSSDVETIACISGNWREIKKYIKQMRYNDRLLGLKHKRGWFGGGDFHKSVADSVLNCPIKCNSSGGNMRDATACFVTQ